ncbi:MAG: transposase [Segetibacter sp.]|nr:transposase [Segetibacter sp.]
MLKTKSNALRVVEATLDKITGVKKPISKFIIHIMELWLSMNCRYVFSNMERWGSMTEKSYRNSFGRILNWFNFNFLLIQQHCSKEIIAVFDPSYIKKSGKHTYGIGMFWSGVRQKALRGLEIGCLAFVDVDAATAMHGIAEQTPSPKSLTDKGQTLVHHYVNIIKKYVKDIKSVTRYLAVDGYFMKQEFIKPLLKEELHIITKARRDANLRYLYNGQQRGGKGRPKRYDGKVNTGAIDKQRIKCFYTDNEKTIYAAVLYSIVLKQNILAAFVYYGHREQPEIIIGTDTEMNVKTLCQYYGLRFQVEFLIRDAKQYTGLEDCQGRDEQKLYTHFNIAMTTVSIAKAAYHLSVPKEQRGSFSMADIKMWHMNQLITKRIFSNLDVDLSCEKIKRIYNQCLNFGRLRA